VGKRFKSRIYGKRDWLYVTFVAICLIAYFFIFPPSFLKQYESSHFVFSEYKEFTFGADTVKGLHPSKPNSITMRRIHPHFGGSAVDGSYTVDDATIEAAFFLINLNDRGMSLHKGKAKQTGEGEAWYTPWFPPSTIETAFECKPSSAAVYSVHPMVRFEMNVKSGIVFIDEWCFEQSSLGSSFVATTQILTPSGRAAIESLKVGDRVIGFDPTSNQKREGVVTRIFSRSDTDFILINESLLVTPKHPFAAVVNSRINWVKAESLSVGDCLVNEKNSCTIITQISRSGMPLTPVFNIQVSATENYFVVMRGEAVLVHNKTYSF
jgi:hypothetical protein